MPLEVLLALTLGVALRQILPRQQAFVLPKLRAESAAALAAVVVAASLAAPDPAAAEIAKFSFFGVFATPGAQSDA